MPHPIIFFVVMGIALTFFAIVALCSMSKDTWEILLGLVIYGAIYAFVS